MGRDLGSVVGLYRLVILFYINWEVNQLTYELRYLKLHVRKTYQTQRNNNWLDFQYDSDGFRTNITATTTIEISGTGYVFSKTSNLGKQEDSKSSSLGWKRSLTVHQVSWRYLFVHVSNVYKTPISLISSVEPHKSQLLHSNTYNFLANQIISKRKLIPNSFKCSEKLNIVKNISKRRSKPFKT